MSAEISSGIQRPRREKANLHPGLLVRDTQTKRRTPVEKQADDLRAKEIKDARAAAMEQGHARVSEMEAAMEVSQAQQGTGKAKPVRPRPRPRPGIGQGRPTNLSGPPRVDGEDLESPFLDVDRDRLSFDPQPIWKITLTMQPVSLSRALWASLAVLIAVRCEDMMRWLM